MHYFFQALSKFIKSVNWSLHQEASQALDLLHKWAPMDVTDALELLSPAYTHPTVRKYAVARLQPADDEVKRTSISSNSAASLIYIFF